MSEVPENPLEFSKMKSAEFAQNAMRTRLSPPSLGSVKARLSHSQSVLGRRNWSRNRVRDTWYADPRASEPTWVEITDLEEITGLEYARNELRTNDQLIANADALLLGSDPDFVSAFVAGMRAFMGALDSARAGHGDHAGSHTGHGKG